MNTRSFYRFPVTGTFADRLREVAEIEGIQFETPFMAYFPLRSFPRIDAIKASWATMEIQGLYNTVACDRQMSVAPLSMAGADVDAEDYDDLPFLVVMEALPMTSTGLALFNTVRDLLMEDTDVALFSPD